MRSRGTARWLATGVAVLAALMLALGLAGGAHRAGALLRGVPRAAVAAVHPTDASDFPAIHHPGKQSAFFLAVDAAVPPALLGVLVLALLVVASRQNRLRTAAVESSRSRGPPSRH